MSESRQEMLSMIQNMYGATDTCMSRTQIYEWYISEKDATQDAADCPRDGCPNTPSGKASDCDITMS